MFRAGLAIGVGLILFLSVLPAAAASDEEDKEERQVEVQANAEKIKIQMQRESARSQDQLKVEFDFDDAEFQVQYEAEAGDAETELELEAEFEVLGEYRDANTNGKFDAGEAVVSAWGVSGDSDQTDYPEKGKIAWGTPTVTDETVGGKTGKKIVAPGTFGAGGRIEFIFHVFGESLTFQGNSLQPTSVKIDIVIENYPYQAQDTALFLVVDTKAESEAKVEHDDEDMEEGEEEGVAQTAAIGSEQITLAFVWRDNATVDGVSKSVGTTMLKTSTETEQDDGGSETKKEERFAFAYPRGTRIVHDPESYASTQGGGGGGGIPSASVALVAFTIGVAGVAMRRRASR